MTSLPPVASGSGRGPTILVVEDEILIRLDLADTLREGGYRVYEAADAQEALALMQAIDAIGLVITDVRMPGELDGLDLVRRIRAQWPGVPVVIASAHWQSGNEHLADCSVAKPYSANEILRIAHELVDQPWPNTTPRCQAS